MVDSPLVRADNIEVKETFNAGRGIFAAANISLKSEVLACRSITIKTLDTARLIDTCYNCHRWAESQATTGIANYGDGVENSATELKLCKGCRVVRYCSQGCQKSSWKNIHKLECSIFRDVPTGMVYPTIFRAILRLLLLRKAKRLDEKEWAEILSLNGNSDDSKRKGSKRDKDFKMMAMKAQEISGTDIGLPILIQIFYILSTNAFTMVNHNFDSLGVAMHPLAAMVNHACDYNAIVRFSKNGHEIQIIPNRKMEKGEEVTISYIDENLPREERQKELRERYFFDCECRRCQHEATNPQFFSLGPQEQSIYNRAVELLDATSGSPAVMTSPDSIEQLKSALHLLKVHSWPPHTHPGPALRQQLVVAYINAGEFSLAFAHATIQYFQDDEYLFPQAHHPLRLVHAWRLVRLMDVAMEQAEAGQGLDLSPYRLNLRYWRGNVLVALVVHAGIGVEGEFYGMVRRYWEETMGGIAVEACKGVFGYGKAKEETGEFAPLQKLMEDLMEAELK